MPGLFTIENQNVTFDDVWYHYKINPSAHLDYTLLIDLTEKNLLKIIEDYSGRSLTDADLQEAILVKDEKNHSLGLFWYIFNYFEKENRDNFKYNGKYVVNNIAEVRFDPDGLIIKGQATPYVNQD